MNTLAERAVRNAEESVDNTKKAMDLAEKYQDELLPIYFFLGYIFGEEKIKFEEMKNKEIGSSLKGLYEKGKKLVSESMKTKECSKCHKAISKEKETIKP